MLPFEPIYQWKNTRQVEALEALQGRLLVDWARHHAPIPEGRLYHYTSVKGLRGILRSGKLWMTKAEYLNDSTEIRYAERLITEALTQRRDRHAEGTLARRTIDSVLTPDVEVYFNTIYQFDVSGIFLASFCERGNLLSQWRGYAASGDGYSLGIRITDTLRTSLAREDVQTWRTPLLRKVIYEAETQAHLLQTTLDAFFDALERLDPHDAYDEVLLGHYLTNFLTEYLFCFKDPAFGEEWEWRLILPLHSSRFKRFLEFRELGGHLVPYIAVDLFEDRPGLPFPVTDIWVGPTLNPELSKKAVVYLLERCDLSEKRLDPETKEIYATDVTVQASKVPFRTTL